MWAIPAPPIPAFHRRELPAVAQRFRSFCDVFDAQPRECHGEGALGLSDGGKDRLIENARAAVRLVFGFDRSGGAQDVGDADAFALARELIAAMRTADADEN